MLTLILASALLLGAPAPKDGRTPTDPPSGEWEVLKREDDGSVIYDNKDRPTDRTMRLEASKLVLVFRGKFPREQRAAYYKNGEAFEIDLSPDDPPSVTRGIWKLDGDTLLICLGVPGGNRPTDFTAPGGSKRTLWTLKRKDK
jgi:uncharacterized protein (TIGR03067 family)